MYRATVLLATWVAMPALAARPMITDDARLTDAGACQVESWHRRDRADQRETWALPACNPGGNLEISAGGTVDRLSEKAPERHRQIQFKTLFQPLTPTSPGIGLAAGYVTHTDLHPASGRFGETYFYVPVSVSLADERLTMHLNLGAIHTRHTRENHFTWGLGAEYALTSRLNAIAETFGEDRGSPAYQMGLRLWLVPDRVQVDATYGSNLADIAGERWFSIGLRLISPRFLP